MGWRVNLGLRHLLEHARETLRDPRGQARWVMEHSISHANGWLALVALSVASAVLTVLLEMLRSGNAVFPLGLFAVTPYVGAIATASNWVITVFLVFWAGRAFGGKGGFGASIALMAWLLFLLCVVMVLQLPVALILLPLLPVTDIAAIVALIYVFCNLVAELHGFRSAVSVFFASLAIALGFLVVVSVLAGLLGAPGVSA